MDMSIPSPSQSFTLGDLELHPVSDGYYLADAGGPFGLVPRVLWSRIIQADDQNRVPMALTCLVLRAEGKTVLIDTGLGDKWSERDTAVLWGLQRPDSGLVDHLARLGLAPEDVDLVINTHLHADHCGGNTVLHEGRAVATFPRAEYWVNRLELADASFPNERTRNTYFAANFQPLAESGQLHVLDGDVDWGPLHLRVTRGHTHAHWSIVIESAGRYALYLADLAPFAVHFERLAWVTAYDLEPMETIESKRRWQRWALTHNPVLIFEHDAQRSLGRLVQEGERLKVVDFHA